MARRDQGAARVEYSKTALLLTSTLLASGITIGATPISAQTATNTFTRVIDGDVVTGQTLNVSGNGDGAFEVMSGATTVDGEGATFSGFQTEGGAGSGGGAGLGGVFFVNTGAALTVRDANFVGNNVVGGAGGGGGSIDVKNAALAIGDKTSAGASNLVTGYTSSVTQTSGGFVLNSVEFGGDPIFAITDGATFGAAVDSSGTTVTDAVSGVTSTGFSFANGLNINDFVTTSAYASDETTASNTNSIYAQSPTLFSTEYLSTSASSGFSVGQEVVGSGVPAGTKITAVNRDSSGNVTSIEVNQAVTLGDLDGFNIYSPPILTGATYAETGSTLNYGANGVPTTLEAGMKVTGTAALDAAGITVTAVDRSTGTVTLSSSLPTGTLSFDASKPGSEVGSNTIFAPSSNTGLAVGDQVFGTGIPAGTTVTAIDGDRVTLSQPVTTAVDFLYSDNVTVSGNTATIKSGVGDIEVGQVVEGTGVPTGTTVTAVNPVTGEVTLSNAITGNPTSIRFISDSAFGGGMNGRDVTSIAATGTSGNDGRNAYFTEGDGTDGQNGLAGANATNGTGGIGGEGGDGSDGLPTNPALVRDVAFKTTEIALAIAEAVSNGVPDPYPDVATAAANAAAAAAHGIELGLITADLIAWQLDAEKGLTGVGGDGGDGGDGGNGSEFFGGGSGGAGGAFGEAALNALGNGVGGAGGSGGAGGFGGGGGAGGQPGAGTPTSAAGEGGDGGFGAGAGSTVFADGSTKAGEGGSGFGGAIFVRSGGTLILAGEMQFAGNTARGGSSADAAGGASGDGVGSDLFMMRGSNVTLSPDAGGEIVFGGTIGDDSQASYEGAQFAEGDGASLTINGEGKVRFDNYNTYTGATVLQSGTLQAVDSVGVHSMSRVEFDGADSASLSELSVPVFLSSGEFTRWVGSESDQVMWTGSGGFAATSAGLTVELGRNIGGNQALVWNQAGFVPQGSSLVLGALTAEGTVTLANDISHNDTVAGEVQVYLVDNINSSADKSVLEGDITAGKLSFDANAGTAQVDVAGALTVRELAVDGGTVDTTAGGTLADDAALNIATGATFVAGTADTVGVVTNDGTYDVNAAQTVASLTNRGLTDLDAALTAGAGGVDNASGATLEQNADITSAGSVTNNGTLTVTGDRRIETTGASAGFTGAGGTTVAAATDGLTVDQLGDTTYSGVISGLGDVTKEGSGTLTITGASTYTGGTTVSEGTLDTTGGGTLADIGKIDVATGATFVAGTADTVGVVTNDGTYDVNAAQTVASLTNRGLTDLDAALTAGAGGVDNASGATLEQNADITSAGSVTNNGTLTVTGDRRIETTGASAGFTGAGGTTVAAATDGLTVDQLGDTTYAGSITGLGSFTKVGSGTLTFGGSIGAITVTDITAIGGGLTLAQGGVLSSQTDLVLDDTVFTILTGAQTLDSVQGDGQMVLNGSDLTLTEGGSFTGAISGAGTLTLDGTLDYTGVMSGDMLALDANFVIETGSAAIFREAAVTDGVITIFGPTDSITAGGLQLGEDLTVTGDSQLVLYGALDAALPTLSAASVLLDGTDVVLAGQGYVDAGTTTVQNGATVAPGYSPGTLQFSGDVDFSNGGEADMEIAGTTPGTEHDQIIIGGRLTLGGTSVLNIETIDGYVPVQGDAYQLLRFDPELRTGMFSTITNTSDSNFVYVNTTGVLTSLGSSLGDADEQLLTMVSETDHGRHDEIASVVEQLADGGDTGNGVIAAGGGNLIPMLAAADASERVAIFSRFTPEGYGGAFEYAMRSLLATTPLFEGVPDTGEAGAWATLQADGRSLGSDSSTTMSDYDLSYVITGVRGGYRTDMVTLGFGVQTVSGDFDVDSGLSGDGSGTQFQLGARFTGLEGGLTPYITFESGSHDLDGSRNALTSTTNFDDVDSEAQLVRIGASYAADLGGGVLEIDASAMAGRVGKLSFSETGGSLPDRLTVEVPEQSVTGLSLGVTYGYQLAPQLVLSGGVEVDHVSGLNDYTVRGRSGGEDVTFETEVPGIDATQGMLSVGLGFEAAPGVNLNLTGYAGGAFGGDTNSGASLGLSVQF